MTLKVRAALKEMNFNCKTHQKLFHISNQVLVEVAFCPTCIWTTFKSYMGHFEPLSPILWSLLSKQILITAEIGCAPVCLVQIHFAMLFGIFDWHKSTVTGYRFNRWLKKYNRWLKNFNQWQKNLFSSLVGVLLSPVKFFSHWLLQSKGFYTFFKPTGSRFVPSKTDEIKK